MRQLDMFAAEMAQRHLQAENAWLRSRLEQAKVEYRKVREDRDALREQVQDLQRSPSELRTDLADLNDAFDALHEHYLGVRRDLRAAQQNARTWKAVAELCEQSWAWQGLFVPSPALSKDVLTQLLTLAHPDKWSHPEASATELAHEVCVLVNKLREGGAR